MSKGELLTALAQFTGTTQWYKHPLFPNFVYTDGVRYLAVYAKCYWLLEFIFSNQTDTKIKGEGFQVWKIEKEGDKATITVENGNGKIVKTFKITYTDFPLDEYTLWFIDKALILKSEY